MRAALADLAQGLFKIRPEELRRTTLAFVYLFTSVGAFIVGRITRTVLFLQIPDYKDQLPLMYVLIAVTVSLSMAAYARVERRPRKDRANAVTLVAIIAVTLGFRFALRGGSHAAYWAFYVWVELYGSFLIVQFWALANEIFNARQAKRLFAVIGGGGVLANVVMGFAISGSVKALGTENLTFVVAGLLAVSLGAVLRLGRAASAELEAARGRGPTTRELASSRLFDSRHVQLIAAVVVLVYVVSTLVDYQFQVIVGDAIIGMDERSAFFGTFFGVTGVAAAVVQFFFTARLLERFGILVALSLLPIAMMTGSVALLFAPLVPALWAATATKGSENILRYTVNDSTLQLFYIPLPPQIRSGVKTVIDGICKPVAIGGAGIIMAVLVGQLEKLTGWRLGIELTAHELSWVVTLALILWLIALARLRQEYLSSLVHTLHRRRLNFDDSRFEIKDEATVKMLKAALESSDEGEVLHALELLRFVTPRAQSGMQEQVAALLRHPAEPVRVAALEMLGRSSALADRVSEMLDDAAPAVRGAAALATCAILRERALDRVQPLLEDTDPAVRASAVAGLIRYGGLDGVLACADTLKRMLSSPVALERRHAAWVLGEVRVHTFFHPLVPLLEDADEEVRRAAIEAAGALKSPELLEPLIRELSSPRLAGTAAAALAGFGPTVVSRMAAVLDDAAHAKRGRANACRVLSRIADAHSIELLHSRLTDPDAGVRTAAISGLTAVVKRGSTAGINRRAVGEALAAEGRHAFELLVLHEDVTPEGGLLLRDALEHRWAQAEQRVFGLLALAYDADTIELVQRNLESHEATTRANAIEVLDNLLAGEEKAFVVPLFEDLPASRKLEQVSGVFRMPRQSSEERLESLLSGSDAWLQVCAAMAVGSLQLKALEPSVRALLDSPSALCRETAIVALRQLSDIAVLKQRLSGLKSDPAASVSRYAGHVLSEIA